MCLWHEQKRMCHEWFLLVATFWKSCVAFTSCPSHIMYDSFSMQMFPLHRSWCHYNHLCYHPWWVLWVLKPPYFCYLLMLEILSFAYTNNLDQVDQPYILCIPDINVIIKTTKDELTFFFMQKYLLIDCCIYLPFPPINITPLV